MKNKAYHIIFFCVAILASFPIDAKIVPNLYRVQIPVTSQDDNVRQQAVATALQQELVRISGNSQVLQNSDIQTAVNNAANYMEQYSYIQTPLIGQAGLTNPTATQLTLQIVFDQDQIEQLLQQANQPIWGEERPTVLLWIAAGNGQTQNFVSVNSADPAISMLENLAEQRGLPLLWPGIPTDNEPNAISITDITQPNLVNIKKFSQTYNPGSIVLLQLINDNNNWSAHWLLLINDQQSAGQSSGSDEWTVLQDGINNIADTLAQHYAVAQSAMQNHITLVLTNIVSLADFVKAKNDLEQLTPVGSVELAQINPDNVQFNIVYKGSQTDLVNAINVDHKLIPVQQPDNTNTAMITYQWQQNS